MRTRFHERVQAIVIAASRLPPDQRTAFIDRAAGSDDRVGDEARALLPYYAEVRGFDPQSPCGTTFAGGTTTFEEKMVRGTESGTDSDEFVN